MVGLGEDLQECGGNDFGRFQRALHEKVLSSICQACQSPRVPRLAVGKHDNAAVRG